MSDLTRDTIPSPADRRPLVPVVLPSWGGGTLYVQRLSALEAANLPDGDRERWLGELVLRSTKFADGTRVWTDDQLNTVLDYPSEDMKPLLDAAIEVNGFGKKRQDDLKGNSVGAPA